MAVNKVSLEIKEATFVSIAGPSGSGKTTLLNLIGLNDRPTSGKVFFKNEDTS
ncbi:ATP-binding cassette domain-containing protein, partial [Candidatus Bathyarchaeota archaeon]|nr:ATP-binding cassette domain-containing protein [Candidatus Bathyarchaeota archaeon]